MKKKLTISLFLLMVFFCYDLSFAQDFLTNLPKVKLKDSKQRSFFEFRNSEKFLVKDLRTNQSITLPNFGYKKNLNHYNPNYPKNTLGKNYVPWESKKRFWAGFGEVALLQFIPFSFSAYLKDWSGSTEKNWTKISFNSMWHNLSSGWIYDGDNFLTNFFAHPYHGNLFFNAGRTNGYNFWESSAFAMSGSVFWEQFMETWEPAFNDWVLTSLNGINLGEVTYRLSTIVTDNKAKGSERMWLEIAGAIINPVRGFNRLISGETHKVFPNPEWRMPENFHFTLSAGSRRLDKNNGVDFAKEGVQEGLFEMEIGYGNSYKHLSTPFSDFNINLQLATGSPSLTYLHGDGNLFGFKTKNKENNKQYFITTLNYDYLNNPGFLFGAASIAANYVMNFKTGKKSSINTNFNLRVIPMGATPDDYIDTTLTEGRNYDFGPGVGVGIMGNFKIGKWDIVNLAYSSGWIWTQSEPADSKHHLHFAVAELQYPMKDYFAIGLSGGVYWRNSYYKNDPDVNFTTPVARVFFKTIIESENSPVGQSNLYIEKKSDTKEKGWKKNLSDIILIEGTYLRNLGEFSQTYNKAFGFYANYGKHFSNKYHLIFKSGYAKFDYRNNAYNDSSHSSFYTVPLQIGGRYYVLKNRVMPYFAFINGINLVFQDRNLNGSEDKQTLVRYTWQAGFGLVFKIMKQLNFDISLKYNDNFYDPDAMMTSFEYTGGLSLNL